MNRSTNRFLFLRFIHSFLSFLLTCMFPACYFRQKTSNTSEFNFYYVLPCIYIYITRREQQAENIYVC